LLRKAKVCALDRLLLERYWGKVGRGLAVELSRRHDNSTWMESLFTSGLTSHNGYSGDSEPTAEKRDDARANKCSP
jgi:hypothetical protein